MPGLTVTDARRIAQNVIDRVDNERGKQLPKSKKSAEEEIDDLVDDLDELEDEDTEVEEEVEEDEDVEDEDDDADEDDDDEAEDEDPDEAPKAKKSKKSKSKSKTPKAKKEKVGIGTKELADEAGVEPRQLRAYIRQQGIQPRDDRDGRYTWPSLKDKEAQRIIKAVKGGAVDRANKERLAGLKDKSDSKKTKKGKKKASSKS